VPAVVSPQHVVAGLTVVTSITYVAGWVLGDVALRRRLGTLRTGATLRTVGVLAAVSVAAGLLGWLVVMLVTALVGEGVTGSLVTVLVGTVVIGVAALAGLVLARVPEARDPLAAVRARLGRG
jgi:putative peptidoglycan lipid II flippase